VGEITNTSAMVGELTKQDRTPLLPLRHAQGDFFVCDIFDAAPKGDMASMAHPIFTLSTKPDTKKRRYVAADGKSYVEVRPNVIGLATVHDRDVLIYCISQVMAALNDGKTVHRTLRFKAYDLLVATNRPVAGTGYSGLKAALERLQGTQIETNICTGGIEQIDGFSLIDRYRIVRETRDGRMLDLEVTLSDWVFNAIAGDDVLTLNRRYFQLRKPLERRLYELGRKQCGKQSEWKCGLEKLQARTGSTSSEKEFKRLVKDICKADEEHSHMPDYSFRLVGDILIVKPKAEFLENYASTPDQDSLTGSYILPLSPETLERARELAPTWDIRALVGEWRSYSARQKTPPKSADAAFLGFCKAWYKLRGRNGW
jgi:Replication initiator protein A